MLVLLVGSFALPVQTATSTGLISAIEFPPFDMPVATVREAPPVVEPARVWTIAPPMLTRSPLAALPWDLPVTRNDRVEYWIHWLSNSRRARTAVWLARAGRYAPMAREKLRARGMPEDLTYLALIESGFEPDAQSTAQAAGLWQFIEATGRRYGLEVTPYVDERRDPIKATDAALDYLAELYLRFGSWYLAAAAYNTGENRVERLLREHAGDARGDDSLYWTISPHLPRETQEYVPLILAVAHIGKEPALYGFRDVRYYAPLAFDTVRAPGGTPLEAVARAIGAPTEMIVYLNQHFVQQVTPPGRFAKVRIPEGSAAVFAANFARVLRDETQAP